MSAPTEVRREWNDPFTVANELIVAGLDDRTRDAVERYMRAEAPMRACDLEDEIYAELEYELRDAVRTALRRVRR